MHSNVTKEYIPGLDGLRGLAILGVVTFHYFGSAALFSFGWSGVDLFFVLSGYLITSRLVATQQQKNPLVKFYRNRALRILPVYYLALGTFFLAFHLFVKTVHRPLFAFYDRNWISFVLFFQNWTMIFSHGIRENYLDHFWSLAVEEQFYLVWPGLLYACWQYKHFGKLVAAALLLIIGLRSAIYFHHPGWEDYRTYFYNTFCRMDGFLAGSLLYVYYRKGYRPVHAGWYLAAGAVVAVGIVITGNASGIANPFFDTAGFTALAVFFCGAIDAIANERSTFLTRLFSWRPLRYTGRISYTLYIVHWIVLRAFEQRLSGGMEDRLHLAAGLSTVASALLCIAVSFGISAVSYRYYESYFLKKKVR